MNSPISAVHVAFVSYLGIELVEQSGERARITLNVLPEFLNSWGVAHGGVIMTMLDYAMSASVRGRCGADRSVLTVDISVAFMNAGRGKRIDAEGRVMHAGRSTFFCESEARDEAGTRLSKAMGTFKLVRSKDEAK